MAVGNAAAARLDELLDQIRMTFESVSQDVEHSKSQHSDYERRGNKSLTSRPVSPHPPIERSRLIRSLSIRTDPGDQHYPITLLRTRKGIQPDARCVLPPFPSRDRCVVAD